MVNKNYIAGRSYEYKIKKKWEAEGYTVLRMAGSHGFADLVAIDHERGNIFFIQCKHKRMTESQRMVLLNEMETILPIGKDWRVYPAIACL